MNFNERVEEIINEEYVEHINSEIINEGVVLELTDNLKSAGGKGENASKHISDAFLEITYKDGTSADIDFYNSKKETFDEETKKYYESFKIADKAIKKMEKYLKKLEIKYKAKPKETDEQEDKRLSPRFQFR